MTWGKGQQLSATVPFPPLLMGLCQDWRRSYLSFYEALPLVEDAIAFDEEEDPSMRSPVSEGVLAEVDWHARLVEAEARLLYEFHRWLRSPELFEIRACIVQVGQEQARTSHRSDTRIEVFLTCLPITLSRFPWEAWEIGTEFGAGMIQIVRTPANIRAEPTAKPRSPRSRARVLAILGDDTGLNFQQDRAAVKSLSRVAEVVFVGWQPGQTPEQVKEEIRLAIAQEQGWDLLFFAGHSNETRITGGELAIAPGSTIRISEIAPQLTQAKERGLQFALFNSCSGLSIAESLIDLGLSQVAVMREPIHNRVAQEFLLNFLQALGRHRDVQDAMRSACQFLKLEKNLTYPSAHLLPSLFHHPQAHLFRIQPTGWKQRLQPLLPTPMQAIALAGLLTLSLLPSVQDALLNWRVGMQARYRDATGQVPAPMSPPPVLLVQIDERSIQQSGISDPNPMDRSYLAQLVDRLVAQDARIIGIDYLLDRQQPGKDEVLAATVRATVQQRGTWLVFAAIATPTAPEWGVGAETGIADPNWSLNGLINALPTHLRLPNTLEECYQHCPFAYSLALIQAIAADPNLEDAPHPTLERSADLRTDLLNFTRDAAPSTHLSAQLRRSHLPAITHWSSHLDQLWLRPIIDFSIPADLAYDRLPAWRLLTDEMPDLPHLSQQVTIIAPGGYGEAGVGSSADSFPMPMAMAYWRDRRLPDTLPQFTGAEAHAYMVHHFLNQHFVVSVPDLWMIGIGIILGRGTSLWLLRQQVQQSRNRQGTGLLGLGAIAATGMYGLVGLQIYVSAGLLLPWLLPSIAFWIYLYPVLHRNSDRP